MNKLNLRLPMKYPRATQSVISTFPQVPVSTIPGTASRLIVIMPIETDSNGATRRIWELANTSGAQVQLLGLCKDASQEPALRRKLVTLVSLLQAGNVHAEWELESGTNWVQLVKQNSQAGDMIVCFAEQRAGLLQRPLSQILQSNLDHPICILSDLSSQNQPQSSWLSQLTAWFGSVGIMVGFFLLQSRMVAIQAISVQTTLLILSVLAEIGLIGIWNSLFG